MTMVPDANFDGNVIPAAIPMGMQNMPQGMPSGMSSGMPQQIPQSMPQGMPLGMPQQIPQSMPQGMPSGMPQQVPQSMPQGMPQHPMSAHPVMPQRAPQTAPHPQAPPPAHPNVQGQRTFTAEELSRYDGKGDNPAYVSVNGIVYDVTDQPGWAAGSHFGLKAGLDQTSAYISCHTGQPMIDRLKVIGRFVK